MKHSGDLLAESTAKFIKVFGERNTGTRALITMLRALSDIRLRPDDGPAPFNLVKYSGLRAQIEKHFDNQWQRIYSDAVLDLEYLEAPPTAMWKHCAPTWDEAYAEANAHVIFCVRNPYSWIISLDKTPYHKRGPRSDDLETFVERPWLTLPREKITPLLSSPLELWNIKNAAYLEFEAAASIPTETLKFEDFVKDSETELSRVLKAFDISVEDVQSLDHSTKDGRKIDDIRTYYGTESWKKCLTENLVRSINFRLDWTVAARLGYAQLDPLDFPKSL